MLSSVGNNAENSTFSKEMIGNAIPQSTKGHKKSNQLNYLEIVSKQLKRCVKHLYNKNDCRRRSSCKPFVTIFQNEDNFGSDYAENGFEENYITLAFLTYFIQLKNRTTRDKF